MAIKNDDAKKATQAIVKNSNSGEIDRVVHLQNVVIGTTTNPKDLTVTGNVNFTGTFTRGEAGTNGADAINYSEPGLRLTLTAGTPIATSDVTGTSTLRYTPFKSGMIALWDGSTWVTRVTSEITFTLSSLTSGKNYDVFAYYDTSTLAVKLELSSAWTNDTTRASTLTRQDGILVKGSGSDTLRRYVGTIRTTGTTTTEDSVSKRFVWNYYNRVQTNLRVTESTTTWSGVAASYRQTRGSSSNAVEYVSGDIEFVDAQACLAFAATSTSVAAATGIGIDSSTTNSADFTAGKTSEVTSVGNDNLNAVLTKRVAEGYHKVYWLEYGTSSVTFVSTQSPYMLAGLVVTLKG